MLTTDITRSNPAANVNAEAITLRELADAAAFKSCKCFAGLWLRFDRAREPMHAATKARENANYAQRFAAAVAYNRERADAIEYATARAANAAALAKQAADAYAKIVSLIREFEQQQHQGDIYAAIEAEYHAWKAAEDSKRHADQCAREVARWIEFHPVQTAA